MFFNDIKSIYFRNNNLLSLSKYSLESSTVSKNICNVIGKVKNISYSEEYYVHPVHSSKILLSQNNSPTLHIIEYTV